MNPREHWENVYRTKLPDQVSWYCAHLQTSLAWVERAAGCPSAAIIDVGGGACTLVDDLIQRNFQNLTVLDVSDTALQMARRRLGARAESVRWLCADVTQAVLPPHSYDVWHDRAVFHFLTSPEQRRAYILNACVALKTGGHVIIATFGPEGPTRCSGLDTMRYDAASLAAEWGPGFHLADTAIELHHTPAGGTQQFLYCDFLCCAAMCPAA
ncbi:MAG: class I SAM-dependent methyltransferase [Bryobacteraceae bacterium]